MVEGYTIRRFRDSDVDEFLDLYETTFEGRHSEEWFDWKYRAPPYIDHVPIIVSESRTGELVGARPFFALKMHFDGTEHVCLQPADAMVHPDHRRRGLFTAMTREAIDIYSDGSVEMFFNFPNEKSWAGNRKLGWRLVSERPTYYRGADPTRLVATNTVLPAIGSKAASFAWGGGQTLLNLITDRLVGTDVDIRCSRSDLSSLSEFHDRWRPRRWHAVRDETFYQWRLSNPEWTYLVYFGYRDGELKGALVTGSKTQEDGIVLTSFTDVLPLLPGDADRDVLLTLIKRAIRDHPQTSLFKLPPGPIPPRVAEYCGFVRDDVYPFSKVATPTLHAVRPLDGSRETRPSAIERPQNWCITFLEEDTS